MTPEDPRALTYVPLSLRERLSRITTDHEPAMRFFKLICSGIDVAPFLTEIRKNENAWALNEHRQRKIQAHRDTNTIFIRSAVKRPDLGIHENQESVFSRLAKSLPNLVSFIEDFAKSRNARLCRATVVRLKPHSRVFRHIDAGSYYFIRDRYHLVLYSTEGSLMFSGDESVRMWPGELWWFDNKQFHEAHNESDQWRIHLIVDLLPRAYEKLAANPLRCRLAY
jgi:aspartyl/asparaginyl beta-hydroxylase (cupin superfamily)